MSGRCRWTRLGAAAAGSLMLGACGGGERGAFDPRGTAATEISWLFWVMLAAAFVVVVIVVVAFVRAARGGDGLAPEDDADDRAIRRTSRLVLGGGVLLPIVILVPLTVAMLVVADRISPDAADDPMEVRVTGHMFWWEIEYPATDDSETRVVTANEMHIPTGTPVRVELLSGDVIHSFWVPQLAGKIDMIPGQTTELVIDADEPGEYLGQCAEFCGVQHARMRFLVIAQPPEEFDRWLDAQSENAEPPASAEAERGAELFTEVGCAACHTVAGSDAQGTEGPDLTHLGSRRSLAAGTLPNTRDELGRWIRDPHEAKPGNLMPATDLDDDDLDDLVAYLLELE